MNEIKSEYLSTKDAAQYLGLAVRTLEGWRLQGGGPRFIKLMGGKKAKVRYTREQLDAWMKSRMTDSTRAN